MTSVLRDKYVRHNAHLCPQNVYCLVTCYISVTMFGELRRFLMASGMDRILDISQIDKFAKSGCV